jgi:hypothetical protein
MSQRKLTCITVALEDERLVVTHCIPDLDEDMLLLPVEADEAVVRSVLRASVHQSVIAMLCVCWGTLIRHLQDNGGECYVHEGYISASRPTGTFIMAPVARSAVI